VSVSVYRKTDQTKLIVVRPAPTLSSEVGPQGASGIYGVQGVKGVTGITGSIGSISNYFLTFATSGSWDSPVSNPFTVSLGTDVDVDFPTSAVRPWLKGTLAGYYSILVKSSVTLTKTGSTAIGPDCQLRYTLNTNAGEPLGSVQQAWASSANASETLLMSFYCTGYLGSGSTSDRFKITLTREGPSDFTVSVNWVAALLHPMGTFATGPTGQRGISGLQGIRGIQGVQGYRGSPSEGYSTYNQIPTP